MTRLRLPLFPICSFEPGFAPAGARAGTLGCRRATSVDAPAMPAAARAPENGGFMSRGKGTVIAGAVALALMLGSPLKADPGSRRAVGEGWLATLWSWAASWAEEGWMIDPNGKPTTDAGPMSDPNGVRAPTTDDGPMIDPNGQPTTDEGPMTDPNG